MKEYKILDMEGEEVVIKWIETIKGNGIRFSYKGG
jgi:hypothetical protein